MVDVNVNVYDDVGSLVPPNAAYTLLSVIQSDMDDVGDEQVPSMEASFMLTGRPGTFTIETPLVYESQPDPLAQAYLIDEYILQAVGIIEAIYAL